MVERAHRQPEWMHGPTGVGVHPGACADSGAREDVRALLAERDRLRGELAAAEAQLTQIRGLVASDDEEDILAAVQFMVTERRQYDRLVAACSDLVGMKEAELAGARTRLDRLAGIEATAITETKRANRAAHERDAARAELARLEHALPTSEATTPRWRRWLSAVSG